MSGDRKYMRNLGIFCSILLCTQNCTKKKYFIKICDLIANIKKYIKFTKISTFLFSEKVGGSGHTGFACPRGNKPSTSCPLETLRALPWPSQAPPLSVNSHQRSQVSISCYFSPHTQPRHSFKLMA